MCAWVRGWRESNIDIGHVGRVSPQDFSADQNLN